MQAGQRHPHVAAVQVPLDDNLDLAWLQGVLLQDARSMASLVEIGLNADTAQRVLQLRAHDQSGRTAVRVNLTSEATFWLNDLERDSMYKCAAAAMCCQCSSGIWPRWPLQERAFLMREVSAECAFEHLTFLFAALLFLQRKALV